MTIRTAVVALALAWPLALHPATDDTLRGFDSASQAQEIPFRVPPVDAQTLMKVPSRS